MTSTTRALRRLRDDDDGSTIIELTLAMALMLVFLGIFGASIITVTKTATKVRAVSASSMQASTAFLRLDNLVRYANAISTPKFDTTSNAWHVEWASTFVTRNTAQDSVASSDMCTQLRVSTSADQLQLRTWRLDPTATSGRTQLTRWQPIASFVINGSTAADAAFQMPALRGSASTSLQQLTINLITASPNNTADTTASNFTFTALNSQGAAASTSPVCQQVGVGDTT